MKDQEGGTIRENLEFIGKHLGHFGVGRTSLKLLAVVLKRIGLLELCNAMILPGQALNRDLLTLGPEFRSRFLTPAEVDAFAREPKHALPRWFVDEARSKGDECYAILAGEELASFGWYSSKATKALGGFLHFPSDYPYMFHGYTLPAYRGKRLHGIGLTRALQDHLERGHRGLVSMVDTTNYPSLVSSYRMGFRDFGRFYKIGPGRWSRVITTGECRALGIHISPQREDHGRR